MWINLSGNLYLFGSGGVTRVEDYVSYQNNGVRSENQTSLFSGTTRITAVKESIDEIKTLLNIVDNKQK